MAARGALHSISTGEIDRLLRERFGHDVHVGGDLVVSNTLVFTVRGTGIPQSRQRNGLTF